MVISDLEDAKSIPVSIRHSPFQLFRVTARGGGREYYRRVRFPGLTANPYNSK